MEADGHCELSVCVCGGGGGGGVGGGGGGGGYNFKIWVSRCSPISDT